MHSLCLCCDKVGLCHDITAYLCVFRLCRGLVVILALSMKLLAFDTSLS